MRRVLVLLLGATLALPAAALAVGLAQGDGTLYVNRADGKVRLGSKLDTFSGVVLGRINVGRLEIIDPDEECDELSLVVWDADDGWERPMRQRDGVVCVFVSNDRTSPMRFRLVRDENEVVISGNGLFVTAVGEGPAFLLGTPKKIRDGTYSINGERPLSMPEKGKWVEIRARGSLP
jgi:hypothetical protein